MTYFSIDVETTGCIAGRHSLLSIGAEEVATGDTFYAVIRSRDLVWSAETQEFWMEHPDALNAATSPGGISPTQAAESLSAWVRGFPAPHIFVAWPASFDKPFIDVLFHDAGVANPFHYLTVDIKSWMCGRLGCAVTANKEDFLGTAREVYVESKFPHHALFDAQAQAQSFRNLLNLSGGMQSVR